MQTLTKNRLKKDDQENQNYHLLLPFLYKGIEKKPKAFLPVFLGVGIPQLLLLRVQLHSHLVVTVMTMTVMIMLVVTMMTVDVEDGDNECNNVFDRDGKDDEAFQQGKNIWLPPINIELKRRLRSKQEEMPTGWPVCI